jgi:trigger factor
MEKDAPGFNVTVEEVGPCKKRLKIEVPKEDVEGELERRLKELKGSLQLPGFRKGRVPKSLVERQFGKQVEEEVKQSLVSNFYQQAVEKNKLEPIGSPEFSDVQFDPAKPLNFNVTFEVKPTFEIANYKGLSLKRKSAQVSPEEVEETLKRISLSKAQLVAVEGGEVQGGDQVLCDYQVVVNGDTVHKEEETALWVVSGGRIGEIMVPELLKALVGAKAGDKREAKASLAGGFHIPEHRNKEATLQITVREIKRPKAPKIDDELAKQLDFPSLEALQKDVEARLEVDKKRWVEQDLQGQVYQKLLEMANFELPKDWIEHQTTRRLYRYQLELLHRGMPWEEIEKETQRLKGASEESVIRDLKLSLMLEYIADKERLYVTEQEAEQKINELAVIYNTTPPRMRRQLEKQGTLSGLRYQLRETKVVELLLKEAKIEEEEKKQEEKKVV